MEEPDRTGQKANHIRTVGDRTTNSADGEAGGALLHFTLPEAGTEDRLRPPQDPAWLKQDLNAVSLSLESTNLHTVHDLADPQELRSLAGVNYPATWTQRKSRKTGPLHAPRRPWGDRQSPPHFWANVSRITTSCPTCGPRSPPSAPARRCPGRTAARRAPAPAAAVHPVRC